jgi:hypothetical protein
MPPDRWSGDEQCEFCLQRYMVELEVRCVSCDRAICPFCVVRRQILTEHVCPHCTDEDDAGAAARSREAR